MWENSAGKVGNEAEIRIRCLQNTNPERYFYVSVQRQLPTSYIKRCLISQGRLELYLDLAFKIAETREQKTPVTQFWLRGNGKISRL